LKFSTNGPVSKTIALPIKGTMISVTYYHNEITEKLDTPPYAENFYFDLLANYLEAHGLKDED
jgi:hypothetical protein